MKGLTALGGDVDKEQSLVFEVCEREGRFGELDLERASEH